MAGKKGIPHLARRAATGEARRRFCVICGVELNQFTKTGRLISWTDFGSRKYCGLDCRSRGARYLPEQETLPQHLESLLDRSGGPEQCWPIHPLYRRNAKLAYGSFWHKKTRYKAHRAAYQLAHGPIPAGLFILHSCDNPPCCNPAHLRAGTFADNMQDKVDRKRGNMPKGIESAIARLTAEQVAFARKSAKDGVENAEIQRALQIGKSTLHRALYGYACYADVKCAESPLTEAMRRIRDAKGRKKKALKYSIETVAAIRAARREGKGYSELMRRFEVKEPSLIRILFGDSPYDFVALDQQKLERGNRQAVGANGRFTSYKLS